MKKDHYNVLPGDGTLKDALYALVAAIEVRDRDTLSHSKRVTRYALDIAGVLGCSADEREILYSACYLHDIGKIGISDSILLKQGQLTTGEYEIIKLHPVIGENILKLLYLLPLQRSVIRHHHERWDGNGYPDGLKHEDIPLLSRILAVADSYDAITTDRPYQTSLHHDQAVAELRSNDDQFDQNVVDAFIRSYNGTEN